MGRQAIKDANPSALVLGPELGWGAVCNGQFSNYMNLTGSYWDIVTVHYYFDACTDPGIFMDTGVLPYLQGRPVWMTEMGWNTCDPGYWNDGELSQSSGYYTMLDAFQARRYYWTAILGYDLYEGGGCSWSILRPDWSNRPAFGTYQYFIASYP